MRIADLADDCGLPYDPEHLHLLESARVTHRCGLDVTDVEFPWRCAHGHTWHATVIARVNPLDQGCPTCRLAGSPPDPATR